MAIKRPKIIKMGMDDATLVKPNAKAELQSVLGIFFALDELKERKEYKMIYIIGVIGVIGTTIYIIVFTAIFLFYAALKP
jgi:hypothetical protein